MGKESFAQESPSPRDARNVETCPRPCGTRPRGTLGKTLNTKTAKFWYIRYILRLAKDQELKIVEAEDKILIYIVSEIQPQIRYILGDMIPPS